MFKKNLKLKDFSDFASKNYVLDLTIPAVEFSRLSDLILNDGDFEELINIKKQVKSVLKDYHFDHYTIETELDSETCDLLLDKKHKHVH